jgi:UDP-N-acetylmuramoyl-L-alanyl-D-glutamate--2,6-diaminopimelate ligase
MEEYESAKLLLFTRFMPRVSVINVENSAGQRFAATARSSRILRVGSGDGCDVRPVDVTLDAQGLRGDVLVAGRNCGLKTRLVGEHNLENVLLALGILSALDIDLEEAIRGWQTAAVPGRLERCDSPADDILVLVDYAHTPDALERALAATRPLTRGRLHCVFGCGGDRDPGKRPKMGAAVGRAADRIIVTNDNPRTEEPRLIADAIELGLKSVGAKYEVELDRSKAIHEAILSAKSGDVVLLAGKGHEPYQIVGKTKHAFDDRVEARRALQVRRGEGA